MRKKIKEFNQTNNINKYASILNDLYPNAIMCKYCHNHIFYYDTKFAISRDYKNIKIIGKSFLTTKKHGEKLEVCENCLKKKFDDYNDYNRSRIFNTLNKITLYAFDIKNKNLYNTGVTEYRLIKKYGKTKGLNRWNEYKNKQAYSNTFGFKNKKYNWTKEDFDEFNKSRAVTKKNLIKKHGKTRGIKKWNNYINVQRKTKSLEYMIEKFGKIKAIKINKSKGLTLFNFQRKYGNELGFKKYEIYIQKPKTFYSKISQNVFDKIDIILSKKYTTYYATKNAEFGIMTDIGYMKLDYFIKELNICIEFNGNVFHANPEIYDYNDKPNPYNKELTAQNIWDNEKERIKNLLNNHNIKTIVIWEGSYKNTLKYWKTFLKKYGILF